MGFRGIVHEWFTSYLANQTLHIDNDHISSKKNLITGVPKGSVLGPLVFLTYMNDIYLCSNKLCFYLFADDTNLLYADNDLNTLETVVKNELNSVCNWLNANKLTVNAKKSNFIIFRPAQKRINHQPCIRIPDNKNNAFALECKEYVKFLGVLIDKNLTWRPHIDHITSKIFKIVDKIARAEAPCTFKYPSSNLLFTGISLHALRYTCQASQCDLKSFSLCKSAHSA